MKKTKIKFKKKLKINNNKLIQQISKKKLQKMSMILL